MVIPVAVGLWAVWTWSRTQEAERHTRRDRLAALFVNPFMSACEDLQSRIYSILELGGLVHCGSAIQTERTPTRLSISSFGTPDGRMTDHCSARPHVRPSGRNGSGNLGRLVQPPRRGLP